MHSYYYKKIHDRDVEGSLETSLSYQLNIEIVFSSASKTIHFHVKRKGENADTHTRIYTCEYRSARTDALQRFPEIRDIVNI